MNTMNSNEEELTIEDIVNLKSTCSKKVFDNFIQQKYNTKIKVQDDTPKIIKKSKEDLEFEKVFGCERNKNFKPTIDKRAFIEEQEEEKINDDDKPDTMSTKFRPRKFREVFKVKEEEVY